MVRRLLFVSTVVRLVLILGLTSSVMAAIAPAIEVNQDFFYISGNRQPKSAVTQPCVGTQSASSVVIPGSGTALSNNVPIRPTAAT